MKAARSITSQRAWSNFYKALALKSGIQPVLPDIPDGVLATKRVKDDKEYVFVMNFSREKRQISVPEGRDLLSGCDTNGRITLFENGCAVIEVQK